MSCSSTVEYKKLFPDKKDVQSYLDTTFTLEVSVLELTLHHLPV